MKRSENLVSEVETRLEQISRPTIRNELVYVHKVSSHCRSRSLEIYLLKGGIIMPILTQRDKQAYKNLNPNQRFEFRQKFQVAEAVIAPDSSSLSISYGDPKLDWNFELPIDDVYANHVNWSWDMLKLWAKHHGAQWIYSPEGSPEFIHV